MKNRLYLTRQRHHNNNDVIWEQRTGYNECEFVCKYLFVCSQGNVSCGLRKRCWCQLLNVCMPVRETINSHSFSASWNVSLKAKLGKRRTNRCVIQTLVLLRVCYLIVRVVYCTNNQSHSTSAWCLRNRRRPLSLWVPAHIQCMQWHWPMSTELNCELIPNSSTLSTKPPLTDVTYVISINVYLQWERQSAGKTSQPSGWDGNSH